MSPDGSSAGDFLSTAPSGFQKSVFAPLSDFFGAGRAGAGKPALAESKALAIAKTLHPFLLETAAADTAYDAGEYARRKSLSVLTGHCGAVATAVQKWLGGQLVRGRVIVRIDGKLKKELHVWNKIGGTEFDLTSIQYGGDGWHPLDDPHGMVRPLNADGVTLEFVALKERELREKISPMKWFKVFRERLEARLINAVG